MKNIPAPPNNMTMISRSAAEGVFILEYKETNQWLGYDMHTGDLLWGPTEPELNYNPYGYFQYPTVSTTVHDCLRQILLLRLQWNVLRLRPPQRNSAMEI